MNILLVCLVTVAAVALGALWLRSEFRRHVNQLFSAGCPMAESTEERLSDIDRKLEAVTLASGEAMNKAGEAAAAVNIMRQKEERSAKLETAPAHRQHIFGGSL